MSEFMENEEGRAGGIGAPVGARENTVDFDIDKDEDAAFAVSDTPSKHDPNALDAHASAGHDLIPLRHWQAKDALGKPAGKFPLLSDWRRRPALTPAEAVAHMNAGKNVGVRLRNIDLVIDVDPRHFAAGDDPLARLKADFGLPDAPFVKTGGGGLHIYMRKPRDMAVRGKLDLFEGIEFKSVGFQVVAAGSIHPETGKPYRLDDDPLALSLSEAPEAPTALLDAITKPSAPSPSSESALIGPEKLADWLDTIDVSAFKDETKWRELMMSCHHATGGSGMDVFVTWSTSDPAYAGDKQRIRRRWQSLAEKPGAITVRTLIAALPAEKRREAAETLGRVAAEDDFPDDEEAAPAVSSISGTWDEWVFVAEAMQFIRRKDGRKYRTDQWKALYGGLYPDGEILNAVWKSRIPIRKF